jgi:hypothetical protein
MASLDSLPADQRAVIQLVLQQGRRYDDIAAMLSIDRAGVRQRALDAFDGLGPDNSIPAPQRALLTDYLLGELPSRVSDEVHDGIAQDPAQRAWLRVIASEVGGLATGGLPPIPAPGAGRASSSAGAGARQRSAEAEPETAVAEGAGAAGAGGAGSEATASARPSRPARTRRTEPALPVPAAPAMASDARRTGRSGPGTGATTAPGGSSRRGGAILLGLGAAVVIAAIVVVLILALGGNSNQPRHLASSRTPTVPSTSTTGTSTTAKAKFLTQVNLNSPSGVKNRVGVAQVVEEGKTLGVLLEAQDMPANSKRNAYAVWLYNSNSDTKLVGFVDSRVGSNGRLETEGPLPSDASHYKHMLVTLETAQTPKVPGPILLEGAFHLS